MLLPGSVLDAGRRRPSGPGLNGFGDRLPVCVRPRRTRASGRLCPAQGRLSGLPHSEQPRTADTPGS
jgi:hypothetical protein